MARLVRAQMAAGIVVLAMDTSARAQSEAEPIEAIRVEYAAPSECPSAAEFFAEIAGRTHRARAAAEAEPARRMRVRVTRADGALHGTLEIDDSSTGVARRALGGDTCGELVAALALVAALSVDPHASMVKQSAPPAATVAAPPRLPARVDDGPARPPAAIQPSRAIVLGVGAQAGLFVAGAAGALPTARVMFDAGLGGDELFSPSARLALARTVSAHGGVGARFAWTVAELELCPVRLGRRIGARPCLTSAAGILDAQGSTAPATQHRSRPWVTTGLAARLYAELTPRLLVELQGDVGVPWVRETFFFMPTTRIYEPPWVIGRIQAGVQALLP